MGAKTVQVLNRGKTTLFSSSQNLGIPPSKRMTTAKVLCREGIKVRFGKVLFGMLRSAVYWDLPVGWGPGQAAEDPMQWANLAKPDGWMRLSAFFIRKAGPDTRGLLVLGRRRISSQLLIEPRTDTSLPEVTFAGPSVCKPFNQCSQTIAWSFMEGQWAVDQFVGVYIAVS
eukprot:3853630-Amphidinium_carterae.1